MSAARLASPERHGDESHRMCFCVTSPLCSSGPGGWTRWPQAGDGSERPPPCWVPLEDQRKEE